MSWNRQGLAKRPRMHGILLALSLSNVAISSWELATGHYRSKAAAVFFLVVGVTVFSILATYAVLILRDRRAAHSPSPPDRS